MMPTKERRKIKVGSSAYRALNLLKKIFSKKMQNFSQELGGEAVRRKKGAAAAAYI